MSTPVTELGVLEISLSRSTCNYCGVRCRGVTFNRAAFEGDPERLAHVGVDCDCWDKLLRLVGDCLVCRD